MTVQYDGHTTATKYAAIDKRVRNSYLLEDREVQVAELVKVSSDAVERLAQRFTGIPIGGEIHHDD